jgi:chitodextrinase
MGGNDSGGTWRRALAALGCALACSCAGAGAASASSPYGTWPACTNGAYAVETQSWWSPMAGAFDPTAAGHIHLGACFPLNGTLSTAVDVDAVIQLHNNPARLDNVRWADDGAVRQNVAQSFSCPTEQCQLVVALKLDPAVFANSGWREIRFTANTLTLDGFRHYNTSRWCVNVVNDKPLKDYCKPGGAGRNGTAGWYTGVEYTNVYIDDRDFPYQPVSGTWCLRAKFEDDRGFASTDPAFHAVPPDSGRVVYDGPGGNVWRTLCVDTRTLSDGVHTLHLRTDDAGVSPAGTASGVYGIKFRVQNQAPPADVQAPTTPGGLHSTARAPDGIDVAWDASTDDSGTVAGYKLYRDGAFLANVTGATAYAYAGLSCDQDSTLEVKAFDAAGNLSDPATLTERTLAYPPPDTTAPAPPANLRATGSTRTSASVAWDATTDDVAVTGYVAFLDGARVADAGNALAYAYAGLTCGTAHRAEVQAYDAAGNLSELSTAVDVSTASCPVADTTPPSPPSNLRATGSTTTSVSIAWSAATDDAAVSGYLAYLDGAQVADAGDVLAYTFAGLTCATTHQAQVKAYDAAGNASALSTPLGIVAAACPPSSRTLNPVQDSSVSSSAPSATTGGAATLLTLDGSPIRRAYLRFAVPAGAPTSVRLRLWSTVKSTSGVQVAKATGPTSATWTESGLSYANAPALGPAIASRATILAGWNEIVVPAAQVDPGGFTTLVVTRAATTTVTLHARENVNRPELVLGP